MEDKELPFHHRLNALWFSRVTFSEPLYCIVGLRNSLLWDQRHQKKPGKHTEEPSLRKRVFVIGWDRPGQYKTQSSSAMEGMHNGERLL